MRVSVCIVAYNEERTLPLLLSDIKKQTYEHKKIEIVLVDSMSTDQTREAMNLFKKENNEFENVLIRENPKKKQASGWNVAIASSSGDVIIRIDAHARIPEDFVQKNIKNIEDGEFVVGSAQDLIPWINQQRGKKFCFWQNPQCLEVELLHLEGKAQKKNM